MCVWGAKKFRHITFKTKSRFDELDEDDFVKIHNEMRDLYNTMPVKVYTMQRRMRKPDFYIVKLKKILNRCPETFIFKKIIDVEEN